MSVTHSGESAGAQRRRQLLQLLSSSARTRVLDDDIPATLDQLAAIVPLRVAVVVLAPHDPTASPHTFGWRAVGVETEELDRAIARAKLACAAAGQNDAGRDPHFAMHRLRDLTGRVFGALAVAADGARGLDDDDLALVATVADQLALAIDRVTSTMVSARLLAATAHDLSNLLGVIVLGAAQLPHDDDAPGPGEGIHWATGRMADVLGDLGDVASIAAGSLVPSRTRQPIAPIVTAAIERVRSTAGAAATDIRCELRSAALELDCDAELVQRIVELVLRRALKNAAGGRVLLQLVRRRDHAILALRSIPPRIDDSSLRTLLGPPSSRNVARRPDLGLVLAELFARTHGGRVWAARRPPIAGTLLVALPLHPASPR